jgi:hypothetical protein
LTFANSGSKDILINSGPFSCFTDNGNFSGNNTFTAFTVPANGSNPQNFSMTTTSIDGCPSFNSGNLVDTFTGSLTGGGTASVTVTVTLQ